MRTLRITTFSITTLSIMTLSKMAEHCQTEGCLCRVSFILNITKKHLRLSGIMLSVVVPIQDESVACHFVDRHPVGSHLAYGDSLCINQLRWILRIQLLMLF